MQRSTVRMYWSGGAALWILNLYVKARRAAHGLTGDRGQDLIEYALVAALISLAATVSMSSVATAIGTAFTKISTHFATYTS